MPVNAARFLYSEQKLPCDETDIILVDSERFPNEVSDVYGKKITGVDEGINGAVSIPSAAIVQRELEGARQRGAVPSGHTFGSTDRHRRASEHSFCGLHSGA